MLDRDRSSEPKHRMPIRVPEGMLRRLVAEAERQDRSLNYVINRAIEEYLDRQDEQRQR